jgi:hypothetical protein
MFAGAGSRGVPPVSVINWFRRRQALQQRRSLISPASPATKTSRSIMTATSTLLSSDVDPAENLNDSKL